MLVDIDTGELFKVHRPDDRSLPIPAVRPGTQKLNLLPVEKTDNGWAVPEQFRNLLTKDMPAVGDLATGVMKTTGEPEFLDLFRRLIGVGPIAERDHANRDEAQSCSGNSSVHTDRDCCVRSLRSSHC